MFLQQIHLKHIKLPFKFESETFTWFYLNTEQVSQYSEYSMKYSFRILLNIHKALGMQSGWCSCQFLVQQSVLTDLALFLQCAKNLFQDVLTIGLSLLSEFQISLGCQSNMSQACYQ